MQSPHVVLGTVLTSVEIPLIVALLAGLVGTIYLAVYWLRCLRRKHEAAQVRQKAREEAYCAAAFRSHL